MTKIYYDEKAKLIKDVKTIGQTIIDKAEDIVGDWEQVQEYKIIAEIGTYCVPNITIEKRSIALRINTQAEVYDDDRKE